MIPIGEFKKDENEKRVTDVRNIKRKTKGMIPVAFDNSTENKIPPKLEKWWKTPQKEVKLKVVLLYFL